MARTTGTASVADLVKSGTLKPGERLEARRRSAPAIAASVSETGLIKVGRKEFRTPTEAAKAALNRTSVDGWLTWRVPRLDDRTLADVRDGR